MLGANNWVGGAVEKKLECLLIYRTIPHYRKPLYRAISKRIDFVVASSRNVPGESRLRIEAAGESYARLYDFKWLVKKEAGGGWFRFCWAPTGKILKELQPRVVVIEGTYKVSATYRVIFHRYFLGGPKVVVWSQGWQMGRGFHGLRNRILQYSRVPLFALADINLVYSDEGAGFIGRALPKKKVVVAHNTLHVDSQLIERHAHLNRPDGRMRVLFVGRLTQDKRAPELADLVISLRKGGVDVELVIVGEGPDYSELKNKEAISGGAIHVVGPIYNEDILAEYFSTSDFCVSLGSLGLMVNHSLAYGCPVVAYGRDYRSGPHHHPEYEYVVDGLTGVIVPSSDPEAMSRVFEDWARDLENRWARRDLIKRYYREKLNISGYADEFIRAIRAVEAG